MSIPGLGIPIQVANGTEAVIKPETQVIEAPESLDQATISTSQDDEQESTLPSSNGDAATPVPSTPARKTQTICCVCEKEQGRYKCPRCSLPYCSIPCLKHHKIDHPPDPPKEASPPAEAPRPKPQNPQPGTLAAAGHNPFSELKDAPELRALFSQFPDLPHHLERIETATHPPSPNANGYQNGHGNGHGRGGGKGGQQGQWNQDKGWQAGIEALKGARKVYGKDGEGVREFGRLVLMILENAGQGEAIIERELEDENTRLIRQLLEQETANLR